MLKGVSAGQFLGELKREVRDDNVFSGAAALAYYLTLAIFPALILLTTALPYLPVANLEQSLVNVLTGALPPEASDMVVGVVDEVTGKRRGGLLSLGLVATLWATSTGMYAIMKQLNFTYDVKEARSFLHGRFTALWLSLLFIVLVIGAFLLVTLGGVIQDWVAANISSNGLLLAAFSLLRWLIIVAALLLGFAVVYYFGPNVEQAFRFVTPGSAIGVLLLVLTSLGFSYYVSNFANYSATYGSIGAVIILMLWLYITGLVLLLGSEVNALVEHHSASGKRMGERVPG